MEPHGFLLFAPPFPVPDALSLVGAAVALMAFLAFVSLGVLLPGLLTALGGPGPDRREDYPEFGPLAYPVISEPAPRGTAPSDPKRDRGRRVARSLLWRHLSGSSILHPASPAGSTER